MPVIAYCWRGVRKLACACYGYLTSGIRRMINRAIRRRHQERARSNEPAEQPPRRAEVRPTYSVLQRGILKRVAYRAQANDVSITSIKKLLDKMERETSYRGTPAALRRLLQELGLKPIVTSNYKEYFMETKKTRAMRTKYLEQVSKFRREGRPIVYTALMSVKLPKIKNLVDHRAVMAFAGSELGMIEKALTYFRFNMPTDQWYYLIRYERYEDWIRCDLMPNLPPNSVVVMRSNPWNKPTMKKTAMEAWLKERDIPFEPNMTKFELRKLIYRTKDKFEHKIIAEMLKANNHTVLRLPNFHDDLNPLEIIWMNVQDDVALDKKCNNLSHIIRLTREKLSLITDEEIFEYCSRATSIESSYRICEMYAETIDRRMKIQESIASINRSSLNLQARDDMVCDSNQE